MISPKGIRMPNGKQGLTLILATILGFIDTMEGFRLSRKLNYIINNTLYG
jgi:hypothetical protein